MPDTETIQGAGSDIAHQQSNADRQDSWIKDGSQSAEPVTTETPASPNRETIEVVRGPGGKFVLRDPATAPAVEQTSATPTPAATASASPSPTAPAPGASAQEIQDFIEAQLGDQPFRVPRGVRIPLKRGDTVEYKTVEQLQKEGMFELDYRHKTAENGRRTRENEQRATELAARQARVAAREQFIAEREAEMVAAQKDPDKWQSYIEMQERYRTDPQFRKVLDDALAKRETDAELAVYQDREFQSLKQEGVALANEWIDGFAQEPAFAGVDPARVRALYAQALATGQAQLDPNAVRAIYAREAQYLTTSLSPLQSQLADLKAQVAQLTAAKGAEKHNDATKHALDRSKAPPVLTGTGRPPAESAPQPKGRFGPNELVERNAEWAKQR